MCRPLSWGGKVSEPGMMVRCAALDGLPPPADFPPSLPVAPRLQPRPLGLPPSWACKSGAVELAQAAVDKLKVHGGAQAHTRAQCRAEKCCAGLLCGASDRIGVLRACQQALQMQGWAAGPSVV